MPKCTLIHQIGKSRGVLQAWSNLKLSQVISVISGLNISVCTPTQTMVQGPTASASAGCLVDMQNLQPHPGLLFR